MSAPRKRAAIPYPAPRWDCPGCNCSSHAHALRAIDLGEWPGNPAGPLLECPICEMGSPLDEWKRTEVAP